MKKFKHFETESGNTIKVAQFDGYLINERPFEGLMFQVEIQDDGSLKVYVKPSDEDYFSDFNQEKWLKVAADFAYEYDIFEDPKTGEECWLIDTDGKSLYGSEGEETDEGTYPQEVKKSPIKVGISNAMDKLNQLFGNKDEVSDTESEEPETKETKIGKFKPNRKFLNFISGVSGARVRFIRDTAFIDGNQLSGILEGVKFKITICDEGTIDFEEVDTNQCDESMIKRLVESIDEMDVTGYTQKFVVANLEFKDKDGNRCYLEVEHQKPIEKFASILDIFKEEESVQNAVSDKSLSILDALFSSETDEELAREFEGESGEEIELSKEDAEIFVKVIESPVEPNDNLKTAAQSYMEEQFRKMNEEKVKELESRIEKTQNEINRYKSDISQAEKKVEQEKENLSVLETRLESLKPKDEPNGYVFNVSELKKNDIELDEKTQEVAGKIADLMNLKKDVLFEYLKGGYHIIKIADKSNIDESPKDINAEVLMKIKNLDIDGKISMISNGEFEYRGDLNWHQLVDRMIKKGFEQDEEFDKLSGSNSYESKEGSKEDSKADSMF